MPRHAIMMFIATIAGFASDIPSPGFREHTDCAATPAFFARLKQL